ncbi:MAG: M16 family metallopeptidase [Candidatus Babeliales bacterium]
MTHASINHVFEKKLKNGLTVLVRPTHNIPKVSIQLWYNVGSKDEKTGQKGIAHLIEHMIFKGTKKLSESDINMIVNKLSGDCNAFTSFDYTGYLFNLPSQNWRQALPIMADCMANCTFKEELLNSELKAVIQELKMYRDDYTSSLIEDMIGSIFSGHPYQHPIIGFKQDLWNLKRDQLIAFYKEHYIPNNATLVVVGDVDPEQVFAEAEKEFGCIKPNFDYKKEEFYFSPEIGGKSVTIYRDVQQPFAALAFTVPGARSSKDFALEVLCWLIGLGKSSRLQKKLIHEMQLCTELEAFTYDLFDCGILFIYFQPNDAKDIQKITDIINAQLEDIAQNGFSQDELKRAIKQAKTKYLSVLENTQKQAYIIGQTYLALGEPNFMFTYGTESPEEIEKDIKEIIHFFVRPTLEHTGVVLPFKDQDKDLWHHFQDRSDQEDARVLSRIKREVEVEKGVHVHTICTDKPKPFNFPKPQSITLPNGLKILFYHNPNIPKVELLLDLKTKYYYDPEDLQGLNMFMSAMLSEGTKKHTGEQLANVIESNGMSFGASPGLINMNMLSQDLEKGLGLLLEILTESNFPKEAINKVRSQLYASIKNFWDTPSEFASQLAQEIIYKNHPYAKQAMGTPESLKNIDQELLNQCYKQAITPKGTIMAIVGDLSGYDIPALLERTLGAWQGPEVKETVFPPLAPIEKQEVLNYPINRDQIVLTYAGLSVSRLDPEYDKLLLFNQIFTGGVLGSMSSRLFELREQSGLFYTIGGSLLASSDKQPGMVFIKTIVSLDRLEEAEKAIEHTINTACNTIDDEEFAQAYNALANSMVNNFEANRSIAATFLFLERYHLPMDYYDTRAQHLAKITKQDVLATCKKFLDSNKLAKIKIGRIK